MSDIESLEKDTSAEFRLRESLRALVDAIESGEDWNASDSLRCTPLPYPGLRYFASQRSEVFFGREELAKSVLERLGRSQIIFVLGGSGCGKSSLIRGGVLPLLSSTGCVPGRDGAWYSVTFRPEKAPVDRLGEAFLADFLAPARKAKCIAAALERMGLTPGDLEKPDFVAGSNARKFFDDKTGAVHSGFAEMQRSVAEFESEVTPSAVRHEPNLLITIDQFEEIFRSEVDRRQRSQLMAMIRYVSEFKPAGVFLAIIMRSEDLHRCAEEPNLAETVNQSFLFVDWLDRLDSVIVEPARRSLQSWLRELPAHPSRTYPFDEAVVSLLVSEAATLKNDLEHKGDHLPLLQHALQIIWRTAASQWRQVVEAATTAGSDLNIEDISIGSKIVESVRENARSIIERRTAKDAEGHTLLQLLLEADAEESLETAEQAYACDDNSTVTAGLAYQAAFCEMASLDENRRYYRAFRTAEEIVAIRFDPASVGNKNQAVASLEAGLRRFGSSGLLSPGKSGWDVTHEALIRNWPRLRGWIQDDVARERAIWRVIVKRRVAYDDVEVLRPVLWFGRQPIYPLEWFRRIVRGIPEIPDKDFSERQLFSLRLIYASRRLYPVAVAASIILAISIVALGFEIAKIRTEEDVTGSFSDLERKADDLEHAQNQLYGRPVETVAGHLLAWRKLLAEAAKDLSTFKKEHPSGDPIDALRDRLLEDQLVLDQSVRNALNGVVEVSGSGTLPASRNVKCEHWSGSKSLEVESGDHRHAISVKEGVLAATPEARQNGSLAPVATQGEDIYPAVPGSELCLSDDATIVTLNAPDSLDPNIYELHWYVTKSAAGSDWAVRINEVPFRTTLDVRSRTSSKNLSRSATSNVQVLAISAMSPDTGLRTIYFRSAAGGEVRAEQFYEGFDDPVPISGSIATRSNCVGNRSGRIPETCAIVAAGFKMIVERVHSRAGSLFPVPEKLQGRKETAAGDRLSWPLFRVSLWGHFPSDTAGTPKVVAAGVIPEGVVLWDQWNNQWLLRFVNDAVLDRIVAPLATPRGSKSPRIADLDPADEKVLDDALVQ